MIIDMDKRWPRKKGSPTTISIGFIDGTSNQQTILKNTIKQWEYCNVRFVAMKDPKTADVRITFKSNGCDTKIGINARDVSKSEATMHLRGTENEKELKRHILHEFGHVLGAKHEHFSPTFPYSWNVPAVENYWKDELKNSAKARDKVVRDINKRFESKAPGLSISQFDGSSIMMYHIKKEWLRKRTPFNKDPKGFSGNYTLTQTDKDYMKRAYTI